MSSSDSLDASFSVNTFFPSAAGPPGRAVPILEEVQQALQLQRRFPVLTLARAFAKKPGQKGSTLTAAALMRG